MKAMTDRYQEIRDALAMGPTPGPWTAKSHAAPRADNGDIGIINGKGMLVAVAYSNTCTRDNASLIAACDPDTIRELLAERDQLAAALAAAQQRIAELERELENERARGIHTCHDQCQRPLCVAQRRIAELESQLRERSMTERISNTELLIDAALAAQQQDRAPTLEDFCEAANALYEAPTEEKFYALVNLARESLILRSRAWDEGFQFARRSLTPAEKEGAIRDHLIALGWTPPGAQKPVTHPAITHCDNCGCDWLDNGLNPIGCPYCKQPAARRAAAMSESKHQAESINESAISSNS